MKGGVYQQRPDGEWVPAEPLPAYGWKARLEFWLQRRGRLLRLAGLLGRWDERGLGK